MTPFRFPLERVLRWRETELAREEARLEQLQSELRRLILEAEAVILRRTQAQNALVLSGAVRGSDLASLEMFRAWAFDEGIRLQRLAVECSHTVEAQKQVTADARRRVRLVERLKDRRREEWQTEFDREEDTQAGEFAVAQWRRQHSEASGDLPENVTGRSGIAP